MKHLEDLKHLTNYHVLKFCKIRELNTERNILNNHRLLTPNAEKCK